MQPRFFPFSIFFTFLLAFTFLGLKVCDFLWFSLWRKGDPSMFYYGEAFGSDLERACSEELGCLPHLDFNKECLSS